MVTNVNNLQTFVCEVLINLGSNKAIFFYNFFGNFFILLLFLLSICSSSTELFKSNRGYSFISHSCTFSFAIAITILLLRFPHVSRSELNPDESQWIASAITLIKDGRFWLSVDNSTSGPLISAPLILIKLFGANINYGTIKLFGVFIWIASVISIYYTIRLFSDEIIARLSLLPSIICVASLSYSDYIAYNSEHIPILMLSVSIFLSTFIQTRTKKIRITYIIILGIILGSVPYSKLQAVPIALFITLYTMLFLNRKYNLVFILSGLFPSIAILAYLVFTGILYDFWTSYIINNLLYAKEGLGNNLSFLEKIMLFPQYAFDITDTNYFFFCYISLSLFISMIIVVKLRRWMSKKEYSLIVFALMIFVSSIYCVIQSGNYFAHYMLLLIIPLTFLLGTLLGLFDSKLSYLSVSVKQQSLLLISGGMLFISCIFYYKSRNPSVFTAAVSNYNSANSISEVAKRILLYTSSDDRIAVWGWASNYHVETQLAQGSRDTHSFYQIRKSFLQDYYLDRYAQDIIKNKPVLFINAVSDKHFVFSDTATQSYHHFPRIKQTIDSLYLYVEEVEGVKIYILKSRASSYSKVQANIN